MELKILGKTYQIVRCDTYRDKNRWAEINYSKQIIEIDKDIKEEKAKECLLHEIFHAVFEVLGFAEENENEHLVQCLANSLHQILLENNDLNITF